MATKRQKARSEFVAILYDTVISLEAAAREDEMKGGGDPTKYEVKELEYKLAWARFEAALAQLEREFGL